MKDTIICELCGRVCPKQVSFHHLRDVHGITTAEYRALGYDTLSPARKAQLQNQCRDRAHLIRRNYGPDHHRFTGGCIDSQGYRVIHVQGKRVKEHRHVMEQKLGRPLTSLEHVHHLDGDKLNNAPRNLTVVTNAGHRGTHIGPTYHGGRAKYILLGETARELLDQGLSIPKVAKAIGVHRTTVHRWVEKGII